MKISQKLTALAVLTAATTAFSAPLTIEQQGTFAVGGTVVTSKGEYNARPPVTQGKTANNFSARSWQTTPDDREGWDNLFLRQGYGVYLVDQPRRGQSGRSTVDATVPAVADDQFWFAQFRMCEYPKFFKGVAFPQDAASLDQFFRQMTPNIGAFDANLIAGSLKALFDRIGDGVLVTHSQGSIVGWLAGIQAPERIKAIVRQHPARQSQPNRFCQADPSPDCDLFRRQHR